MYSERGIIAPAGIRSRHAHCHKTALCAAVILALVAPHALGAADGQWAFELAVVGPDRKPIPNANVDFRTSPAPTAEQVIIGKFGKKANYGSLVTTDDNGLLKVNSTRPPKQLWLYIITPGYGPFAARWSPNDTGQLIPGNSRPSLKPVGPRAESSWTADGHPVEGVTIHPSIEFRKPPDYHSQLAIGNTAKTDKDGKWHFDSVPISLHEVHVSLDHPAFRTDSKSLSTAEFAIERGKEPTAKIVLDRGIVVTGKITDGTGTPIAVACCVRANREAKSGDGRSL